MDLSFFKFRDEPIHFSISWRTMLQNELSHFYSDFKLNLLIVLVVKWNISFLKFPRGRPPPSHFLNSKWPHFPSYKRTLPHISKWAPNLYFLYNFPLAEIHPTYSAIMKGFVKTSPRARIFSIRPCLVILQCITMLMKNW